MPQPQRPLEALHISLATRRLIDATQHSATNPASTSWNFNLDRPSYVSVGMFEHRERVGTTTPQRELAQAEVRNPYLRFLNGLTIAVVRETLGLHAILTSISGRILPRETRAGELSKLRHPIRLNPQQTVGRTLRSALPLLFGLSSEHLNDQRPDSLISQVRISFS